MENQQPSNERKASLEEELIRGRDTANQLLEAIVHKSNTNCHGDFKGLILPFAEDLVRKVLKSFTNTLLLLNSTSNIAVFDEEVLPISVKDLSPSNCLKPEEMDKARESFFNSKVRRGCHKRKSNALSWEKDSSILTEDGYAWRKYGQKRIMNAKYLRSYYRCTYKYDEDCSAIKQVQRIQDDPPLYRTLYYGHHNCKSSLTSKMTLEPNISSGSSVFLSFNNSLLNKEQNPYSSTPFASTKQEPVEVIPYYDNIAHNQFTSSDYPLSCDYELDFDYLRHAAMLSSTKSVQFDDVCGRSLDFDFYASFGI